jgi:lipopolysaccharide/colanic/teichoic acid biosynthesis glycosyltransferase
MAVHPDAMGWARIKRDDRVMIEDSTGKLAYGLFCIKSISLGLDLPIMFQTVKILVLRRGFR